MLVLRLQVQELALGLSSYGQSLHSELHVLRTAASALDDGIPLLRVVELENLRPLYLSFSPVPIRHGVLRELDEPFASMTFSLDFHLWIFGFQSYP